MDTSKSERSATAANGEQNWQELCGELRKECDRLRLQVDELQAERDAYLKALYALYAEIEEPVEFDEEELLANVGKEKPLEEFIAELEASGN